MLAYNKATLYGNAYIDYVWVRNKVDDEQKINEVDDYNYAPKWDSNTMLLATFDENINGGNVASVTDDVLYWQIYKRKPSDRALTFVTKVPAQRYELLDFNVLNNEEYQYTIFAETKNYISAPLEQVGRTKVSWWNWSLVGLEETDTTGLYYSDNDNIWLFDTMITSNGFDQNIDKYITENFTRFPKVSSSKKNYLSSSITAFLSNVDPKTGKYVDTVEQYNKFIDFIAQPTPKLLRDRKGNGWVVSTTGNSLQYIDESSEQITRVSFNFVQLDDVANVNVINK